MPRGDAQRIRGYLCRQVEAARQADERVVTFRAGDVHDALGLWNSFANVCQVLEGPLFHERANVEIARYVYRPPSGRGANLEIEFLLLPTSGASRERSVRTTATPINTEQGTDVRHSLPEASDVMDLLGYGFVHASAIEPERGPDGAPLEFMPQSRYAHANATPLNRHGQGPFCRFDIPGLPATSGVYAVTVDDALAYVGISVDLAQRWGPIGYANISPRNCFVGGQPTNCKVNHYILLAACDDRRIDLWIHETSDPKPIEASLIRRLDPPWNGHRPRSSAVHGAPEASTPKPRRGAERPQGASSGSPTTEASRGSGCLTALLLTGLPKLLRLLR